MSCLIKTNKGFSLLEVIIYIALFSIIMTGAFAAAYELLHSAGRLNDKAVTAEEGGFVMKKINWALSDSFSYSIGGSGCNETIRINRRSDPTRVDFELDTDGLIQMSQDGGAYHPITTVNASTTCLMFGEMLGSPSGITGTTTIDGLNFSVTRYERN